MSPSEAQGQQKLVLGRQEIVRQHCENMGKIFYSGVMGIDAKAVQAQYPLLKLTPKIMCSPEFVQTLNVDMNAGKFTLPSIGFGRPEHVRFLANDPEPRSQGVFCVSPSPCLCVFRGLTHVTSHTHMHNAHRLKTRMVNKTLRKDRDR